MSMGSDHCGTPRGMDHHRNVNEPPCKWCVKAVEAPAPPPKPVKVKAPARPRGKRVGERPPCGTLEGYRYHAAHDPKGSACQPCKDARAKYSRDRYHAQQARKRQLAQLAAAA